MKYAFHVSPSLKCKLSTQQIMRELTLGLMVIFVLALAYYGLNYGASYALQAIILLASSLITVFVCEAVFAKIQKQPVKDFLKNSFGWVTGIILTLMVPITMTPYALIVATFFAIVFSKLLFGGFGQNIYNPAAVGRAVIFAAFTGASTDLVTQATPTGVLSSAYNWLPATQNVLDTFFESYGGFSNLALGFYPGALGETFAIGIIIVGIVLAIRHVIDWRVPVVYCLTIFVLTAIVAVLAGLASINGIPALIWYPCLHLMTGGVLFGGVFMLTDPVTSPTSAQGRVIFALGAGVITVLIRLCGNLPEGCLYSILLMNTFTPMIEQALDGVQLKTQKKACIICACLALLGVGVSFYAATVNEPVTQVETSAMIIESAGDLA